MRWLRDHWHFVPPALALSLLAALIVATFQGFAMFYQARNETIEGELNSYDRFRSVAAFAPKLVQLEANTKSEVYSGLFLETGTPAVASANLLSSLNQMAASQNVQIVSTHDLPPKQLGPILLVGGEVQLSGTIPAVYALLQQIELAKPFLVVDKLSMRADGNPADEAQNDTALTVELRVFGAMRAGINPEVAEKAP